MKTFILYTLGTAWAGYSLLAVATDRLMGM